MKELHELEPEVNIINIGGGCIEEDIFITRKEFNELIRKLRTNQS